ncbi:MAG: radical SAM protein [Bacilli bacterium]
MNKENKISSVLDIHNVAGENNTLTVATLELLTNCNWKCEHCYLPTHTNNGLSKEVIFNTLKELRDMGCFEIAFTGGEIFFRKDMMEIIKRARELGFNVFLLTNISLLTENQIEELSKLYIANISCTLFALDEEIHDSITHVKGSLSKAIENIKLIKKYEIPLKIKTVIMKKNYDYFDEIEQFCNENGFGYKADYNILSKNDGDNETMDLMLSDDEIKQILLKIDDTVGYKSKTREKNELICPSIRNSIFIDCEGNVYPCNRLFIKQGNILEMTIKEIWENSHSLKQLKSMTWGDLDECFNCSSSEYCVRCPGASLLENGNVFSKNLNACKIANLRKSLLEDKYNEKAY